MNIFRVADEKAVPSWLIPDAPEQTPVDEVKRINIAEEVNDLVLVQECDRIEECATNGDIYHYSSHWDNGTVSHLREYAIACGMDLVKFRGFDPSGVQRESKSNNMVKIAQVQDTSARDALLDVMGDPFHIDERSDMSYMEPAKWQTIKKQNNLSTPSMNTGSVMGIGGGENYFLNSDVNPAKNQNSITNPDAIKQLIENGIDDTGVRLRKQQKAKEDQKKDNHSEWQQEKIDAMSGRDILSHGCVFPTESLNANSGLNNPSSQQGIYAKFDPDSVPEQTSGEKLASLNEERKASIQRPIEKDDWQKPCKQSSRSISDSFANSLEVLLKK